MITIRPVQLVAALVLAFGVLLGSYSFAAAAGVAPATPWSPIGVEQRQFEQIQQDQMSDLRERQQEFEAPAPSEPAAPQISDNSVRIV